jgi:hypothetical protein
MRTLLAIALSALLAQDKPALPPEPDAAAQKDTLKQVKDLFKDDYAKKAPADQAALARKLLEKGVEAGDDPASKFVLLKEARDVAAAAGDAETALRAAHEMGRAFAVDGPALKLLVIVKMSSSTRDAEVARTLAKACIPLVADAVRGDGYETATSALAKAETLARAAQDAPLSARVADLKREVASLKDEYTRVKPMLEKPGTGDAEAVGRYLCFVKGDWEAGFPHLVAGAKGPLKAVVEKDVLNPAEADKQVEVAEAWSDLAQKERSAWRKSRLQMRVRHWLEKAQPAATGVLKLKIDKKLGEMEEVEPGAVNLLRMVDPKVDAIGGAWTLENGALMSGKEEWARIQMPYTPPEEYDLTVVVERKEGADTVGFGLGQGKTQFSVWVDGFPAKGGLTGLDQLDGMLIENQPGTTKGTFLKNDVPSTVVIAVRRGGVSVQIDGKAVLTWQGNYSRLGPSPVWKARDPKAPLLVGAFGSRCQFSKILLTPVSGQGKKLR